MTQSKDEFLKKLKRRYDDLNYQLSIERNRLEAKSQHLSADARQKIEKELERVEQLRKNLKEKIVDMEVSAENAWDDFRDDAGEAWNDVREGAEKSWQTLSEAFKKAASRFK